MSEIFYGVKFENDKIVICTGTKDQLYGMFLCETELEARVKGRNLEHAALRKEFNAMTVEELSSDRAKELERRIWGRHAADADSEFESGIYIKNRILQLEKAQQ